LPVVPLAGMTGRDQQRDHELAVHVHLREHATDDALRLREVFDLLHQRAYHQIYYTEHMSSSPRRRQDTPVGLRSQGMPLPSTAWHRPSGTKPAASAGMNRTTTTTTATSPTSSATNSVRALRSCRAGRLRRTIRRKSGARALRMREVAGLRDGIDHDATAISVGEASTRVRV